MLKSRTPAERGEDSPCTRACSPGSPYPRRHPWTHPPRQSSPRRHHWGASLPRAAGQPPTAGKANEDPRSASRPSSVWESSGGQLDSGTGSNGDSSSSTRNNHRQVACEHRHWKYTQIALVTDGKLLMTAHCHHPVFLNCSLQDIRHKEKTNLSFLVDDRHGIL